MRYRICTLSLSGTKLLCLSRGKISNSFLSKQMHLLRLSIGLSELLFSAAPVHIKNKAKFTCIFCLFWGLSCHCDFYFAKGDSALSSWHCSVYCAAFCVTGIPSCKVFSATAKGASNGGCCCCCFLYC